ncbi:hypothetical protein D9M70_416390 [compost metagenome]
MLPVVQPALFLVLGHELALVFLVVEVGGAQLSLTAAGQVAEFAFRQQAALGHVARVQGGVVVRRQVEVVRRDQQEAGVAAAADGRRQEAGLATVVDREIDVRGIEHRNVLDPQGDVGRGAETGGRVQLDVVALQVPGVVARFAAGVGAILQADDGVFLALGVQRVAAGVGLVQHVLGVVDLGFAVVQLQLGVVADHQGALVAQLDVADQFATVLGLVQVGFVGLHLHAALAQDHVAGEGGDLLLLLVARGLGGDVGGRIFHRRVVVHARTPRLDVGTGAIRAGFGQLGRSELVAWHPVEVTVVGAAGGQALAFGLGDQGGIAAFSRGLTLPGGRADGRAHGTAAVNRTRW